jgi:hypothetical protein
MAMRRKKILLLAFAAFILIQFIQPARNRNGQVVHTDISKTFTVPPNVKAVLEDACYDCHSNNTRYPWYSYIQPAGWWLSNHIKNGKAELNFSEFGAYSNRRQLSKLRSIGRSIKDEAMPLASYTLLHRRAKLTPEEKALLTSWVGKMEDSLMENR